MVADAALRERLEAMQVAQAALATERDSLKDANEIMSRKYGLMVADNDALHRELMQLRRTTSVSANGDAGGGTGGAGDGGGGRLSEEGEMGEVGEVGGAMAHKLRAQVSASRDAHEATDGHGHGHDGGGGGVLGEASRETVETHREIRDRETHWKDKAAVAERALQDAQSTIFALECQLQEYSHGQHASTTGGQGAGAGGNGVF